MILPVFNWWFVSTILAVGAFPLVWRLFSRLPDRGYGFVRTIGLLICGYGYWLGASLQFLPNSLGGSLAVLLLLVGIGVFSLRRTWSEIRDWLSGRWRMLLVMELVFLISFAGWAWIRANNPEITGTEKPMELAFINAILHSDGFPPRDPWLSGYAISYYYFGYVLLSLMIRLTGVTAGVGFNLGNSLWFALVSVGAYSILYNWFSRSRSGHGSFLPAFLGPILTLICGNLAGFLEILHSRHVFWVGGADGILRSGFWSWLGLENLEDAPIGPASWIPQRYLWWWRASRVIRDLDLNGVPIGVQSIDEFPFFSFLLADNHPHLLALPVALLALAFALQLYFRPPAQVQPGKMWMRLDVRRMAPWFLPLLFLSLAISLISAGPESTFSGFLLNLLKWIILDAVIFLIIYFIYRIWSNQHLVQLGRGELVFGAWLLGGLAFLNTWDFLPYMCVIGLVLIWGDRRHGLIESLKRSGVVLFVWIALGAAFYLPWYPTFGSQLSGILPHMLQPTRLPHFIIMFGPSLVPITIWLLAEIQSAWRVGEWRWLLGLTLGIPLFLQTLSWLLAGAILTVGGGPFSLDSIFGTLGVASLDDLIRATVRVRLTGSWTALYLGFMLAAALVLVRRKWRQSGERDAQVWAVFLIVIGALLIIGPEYLYLRDQFGLRMNTIFKFYYAAWILWSLAAGIALFDLWGKAGVRWLPVQLLALLPLLLGLTYPVASVWTKTQGFNPTYGRNLNGSMHPSYMQDDDRQAIQWLRATMVDGVIAEAIGGSYTYYARVSTHTGIPTVLGWPGHEGQWRGGYLEQGSRQDDIRQLYQTPDWPTTLEILDRYGIDYVYLGELERMTYAPVFEAKFEAFMKLVYANETVKIYARQEAGSS